MTQKTNNRSCRVDRQVHKNKKIIHCNHCVSRKLFPLTLREGKFSLAQKQQRVGHKQTWSNIIGSALL